MQHSGRQGWGSLGAPMALSVQSIADTASKHPGEPRGPSSALPLYQLYWFTEGYIYDSVYVTRKIVIYHEKGAFHREGYLVSPGALPAVGLRPYGCAAGYPLCQELSLSPVPLVSSPPASRGAMRVPCRR